MKVIKKIFICILIITLIPIVSVDAQAATTYYRNQLDVYEKSIYDEMYNYFYTNSNNVALVTKPNYKTNILDPYDLQDDYGRSVNIAFSALVNDIPNFYWAKNVSATYQAANVFDNNYNLLGSVMLNSSIMISGSTSHSATSRAKYNAAFTKAIKKINKYAGKNPSKAKIVKAINKWICKNTSYSKKYGNSTKAKYEYLHNAYGVFVKKKAVCDGYSDAFKALCDYYNIPCINVLGYAKTNTGKWISHQWNYVQIKKKWYVVDTTWNDTGKKNNWLLCGSKISKKTHKVSRKRLDILGSGCFKVPTLSKKKY